MAEHVKLCHICGKIAKNTCRMCGKPVCSEHYDAATGSCPVHKGKTFKK